MPSASQLEEFGLEVEHEHHALILPSGDAPPPHDDDEDYDEDNDEDGWSSSSSSSSYSHNHRQAQRPIPHPAPPSREQRQLLRHANVASHTSLPARFVRALRSGSGRLSAALTLSMLAFGVLAHLRRERAETDDVESRLPEVVVMVASSTSSSSCADDDVGFDAALFGRHGAAATERPMRGCVDHVTKSTSTSGGGGDGSRSTDEICDEVLVGSERVTTRDYCRRSCGMCEDIEEDAMVMSVEGEDGTAASSGGEKGGKGIDVDGNEEVGGTMKAIERASPIGDANGQINKEEEEEEEEGEGGGAGKDHVDKLQIEGARSDNMPQSTTKIVPSSAMGEEEETSIATTNEGGSKITTSMQNDEGSIRDSDENKEKMHPESESSSRRDDPPALQVEEEGVSHTRHDGGGAGNMTSGNVDDGIDEGDSGGTPRDAVDDKRNDVSAESESEVKIDSGSKTNDKNVDS